MRRLDLAACSVDLETGVVSGPRPARLTPRELSLLRYLADRPGHLVPREVLLVEAFGYRASVSSRAVDKAWSSLRQKVELHPDQPEHLLTVRAGGYRFVPAVVRSRLPPELDRFVGRGDELTALGRHLERPGLCTVTGPGGVGKTRLALSGARALAGAVRAVFCDLASARTADDLALAVGAALDAPLPGADPDGALRRALALSGRVLLILDGFEQLAALAGQVGAWREHAPELTLLVTSRQPLGVKGEQVLRLGPLDAGAAVELLRARAAQRGVDLVLQDPALPLLADRLDRLPLALELAAAHLVLCAPRDLLDRLGAPLDVLHNPDPEAPVQQRSLRDTLDWSWSLLPGAERDLLCRLSVFPASFSLEGAEAVAEPPPDGRTKLAVLGVLVERGLVRGERGGPLRLLESVRAYASERLDALGAAARTSAEEAHAAWLLQRFADHRRRLVAEPALRDELDAAIDDVVAACTSAVRRGDGSVAGRLCVLAFVVVERRGPWTLARDLAEAVLASPNLDLIARVEAGVAAGTAWGQGGAPERALTVFEAARATAVEGGELPLAARVLRCEAQNLIYLGRLEEAQAAARQAMEWADSDAERANAAFCLVEVSALRGDWAQAALQAEVLLATVRAAGHARQVAFALGQLGPALRQLGRLEEAEAVLTEALEAHRPFGGDGFWATKGELALVAGARGDWAAQLAALEELHAELEAAGRVRNQMFAALEIADALLHLERLGEARAWLDQVERLAAAQGDPIVRQRALLIEARIRLERGRAEDALRLLDQHLEPAAPAVQPLARLVRIAAHHQRGDDHTARRLLDELRPRPLEPQLERWALRLAERLDRSGDTRPRRA